MNIESLKVCICLDAAAIKAAASSYYCGLPLMSRGQIALLHDEKRNHETITFDFSMVVSGTKYSSKPLHLGENMLARTARTRSSVSRLIERGGISILRRIAESEIS